MNRRHRLSERRKTVGLSQERLAEIIGVDTSTVARWERGMADPLAVHRPRLAEALRVPVEDVAELLISTEVSSQLVERRWSAVQLHAWGALRTLEDLGVFVRSDMLTRRDLLAAAIAAASGKELVEPIAQWLETAPAGLPASDTGGMGRIGMSVVDGIERTVREFAASDASAGGGLAREAALGQLKYTVDLAQHASYSAAVGTRLLTVIADLAGWVGWMSYDAGMSGPAQRYFWYGIQAAHEAGTERAQLRAVGILTDLAIQAQAAGQLDTARQLLDLALEHVPDDERRFNAVRAILRSRQATVLSGMGMGQLREVNAHVEQSFDLFHRAGDDEHSSAVADYYPYACEAELASVAAGCYLELAQEQVRHTSRAEDLARQALNNWDDGYARSKVFDQVTLTRIRLCAGELDQACADGQEAIRMAAGVSESKRVRTQLGRLRDEAGHQGRGNVRELRERLELAISEGL
jgi:transcriptional regulator with XRE-family HTH domain/tetratricopeptide (TPR) repeat protein